MNKTNVYNREYVNTNPVILSAVCNEPDGEIEREVKLSQLTISRLKFLWEKLSEFDVLFNDFTRGNEEAFIAHFLTTNADGEVIPNGLFWDVDEVGMFILNELKPPMSASAHLVFWDLRFKGRENLCREMIRYVIEKYDIGRIELKIPLVAKYFINAVERMGFVKEGRLRKTFLYKGEWFDMNVYSILKGDLEEPERDRTKPFFPMIACTGCGETFYYKRGTD